MTKDLIPRSSSRSAAENISPSRGISKASADAIQWTDGSSFAAWSGALLAVILSVAALVIYRYLNHRGIDLGHERYGYAGIFLLTLISNASVLIPVPGLWLATLFGRSLNPILVGLAGGLGSSMGELSGYLAGVSGKALIEKRKRAWYDRIHGWMGRNGFITIFLFAFFPNPIFDLGGIVAGTAGYSPWLFFSATLLARLLKFTLFAWLGHRYLPQWLVK